MKTKNYTLLSSILIILVQINNWACHSDLIEIDSLNKEPIIISKNIDSIKINKLHHFKFMVTDEYYEIKYNTNSRDIEIVNKPKNIEANKEYIIELKAKDLNGQNKIEIISRDFYNKESRKEIKFFIYKNFIPISKVEYKIIKVTKNSKTISLDFSGSYDLDKLNYNEKLYKVLKYFNKKTNKNEIIFTKENKELYNQPFVKSFPIDIINDEIKLIYQVCDDEECSAENELVII